MIAVDLFAGGGGASQGIYQALGVHPVIAVNHCRHAIEMHRANHPSTIHFHEDVYEVNPLHSVGGRRIDLMWASPDCTHHSRAKGGKPLKGDIRGLAWVVLDWAQRARPRVIFLENVPEFEQWGPLHPPDHPDPRLRDRPIEARRGETFREFVAALQAEGYTVEWRCLRACDYGAPTIRNRLYLVARLEGSVVWPEPTHGPGRATPWRTAAECIDWSIPSLSIFATPAEAKAWKKATGAAGVPRRPLADATLRRIATGVVRFVLEDPEPFIVRGAGHALAETRNGERAGQAPRVRDIRRPLGTVTAIGSQGALVSAFLAKHYTGVVGSDLRKPTGTVTAIDHHSLVAVHLTKFYGTCAHGSGLGSPAPTVTAGAGGGHAGLVSAFLCAYYGSEKDGQALGGPMRTVTGTDRFGLVTVEINGAPYVVTDIAMRMLQPRELLRAMMGPGVADAYTLIGTRTEQIARIGNMVCPDVVRALVGAQFRGESTRTSREGWLFGQAAS